MFLGLQNRFLGGEPCNFHMERHLAKPIGELREHAEFAQRVGIAVPGTRANRVVQAKKMGFAILGIDQDIVADEHRFRNGNEADWVHGASRRVLAEPSWNCISKDTFSAMLCNAGRPSNS